VAPSPGGGHLHTGLVSTFNSTGRQPLLPEFQAKQDNSDLVVFQNSVPAANTPARCSQVQDGTLRHTVHEGRAIVLDPRAVVDALLQEMI
jgi:hypothetical protein